MTCVPFEEAKTVGDRFIELLAQNGINPHRHSIAEQELLSLVELIDVAKNPVLDKGENTAKVLRAAAGLLDFSAKVLSAENAPEFALFIEHLKLINKDKSPFSSLIQNDKAKMANDTNRKLTELYVATLLVNISIPGSLKLDNPTNSKGDNPDILFDVNDLVEGKTTRWAIAIKSVSGRNGQTYFERIKEAAEQIDADRCSADRGIVFLNIKDTLDHDLLWETVFPDLETAQHAFRQQIIERVDRARKNRDQGEWDSLFTGKVVRPLLFMAHTLVRIDTPLSYQTPTILKMVFWHGMGGVEECAAVRIAFALNDAMQTIRLGIPGTVEYAPA